MCTGGPDYLENVFQHGRLGAETLALGSLLAAGATVEGRKPPEHKR